MNRGANRPPVRIMVLLFGLTYWALTSLFHLKVSLFLISPLNLLPGRPRPSDYILEASLILGALFCAWIMIQLLRGKTQPLVLICALCWAMAAVAANRFLVSTSNEYVHYPQYAALALFLYFSLKTEDKPLPVFRILFWATLLGIIDEAFQYFYICPGYGDYLDFNDFILNQLGACGGIILAASTVKEKRDRRHTFPLPEAVALAVLLAALGMASYAGSLRITPSRDIPPGGVVRTQEGLVVYMERRPGLMGSWQNAQGGGAYYVLTASEGTALMVCIMAAAAFFDFLPPRHRP